MLSPDDYRPGQRVRVIQEIQRRDGNWQVAVDGVIESVRPEKTGSWLAQGKDDKLWLLRIRLRKDDGEQTTLSVDQSTRVERLATPTAGVVLPADTPSRP